MVQPGDVLLTHGSGAVSWAIRFLDRSPVNHAAIVLDADHQAEAVWNGVKRGTVADLVARNDYAMVRRSELTDTAPVVAVANDIVDRGVPYAYQQLVLLAVLCATRAVPLPRVARGFVRRALDGAADALNDKVDRDGSTLMICSEYVYRCYAEATPSTPLSIEAVAAGAAAEDGYVFLDDFVAQHRELIAQQAAAGEAAPAGLSPSEPDLSEIDAAIGEYAAAVAAEQGDAEAAEVAAEHAGGAVVAAAEEVSDPDLARALVRFSGGLERAQPQSGAEPAGVGLDLATGALKGLLDTKTNPNFVTPGDLLRSRSLKDAGRLPS